jgi:hypothetical protein
MLQRVFPLETHTHPTQPLITHHPNTWRQLPSPSPTLTLPRVVPRSYDCYAMDYGSTACGAWDVGKAPYCAPDPTGGALPGWCGQSWCYVDRTVCRFSDKRLYASGNVYARDLYYSYDTCTDAPDKVVNALTVRGSVGGERGPQRRERRGEGTT